MKLFNIIFLLLLACYSCFGLPLATGDRGAGYTTFKIPMTPASLGRELIIREPSICDGAAWWNVSWSNVTNSVDFDVHFFGLPYKPKICFDYENINYGLNQFPFPCIENGNWKIHIGGFATNVVWFWNQQGILIGNEYELYNGLTSLPPNTINSTALTLQYVITNAFQPELATLSGTKNFHFQYDSMSSLDGTTGFLVGTVPYNLTDPNTLVEVYTNYDSLIKPIVPFNFGDVVDSLNFGGFLSLTITYEPDPSPEYLKGRTVPDPAWNSIWIDPTSPFNELFNNPFTNGKQCGTFQLAFPGQYPSFLKRSSPDDNPAPEAPQAPTRNVKNSKSPYVVAERSSTPKSSANIGGWGYSAQQEKPKEKAPVKTWNPWSGEPLVV